MSEFAGFLGFGDFLGRKVGFVGFIFELDSSNVCLDYLVHKWSDAFFKIATDRRHWKEVV